MAKSRGMCQETCLFIDASKVIPADLWTTSLMMRVVPISPGENPRSHTFTKTKFNHRKNKFRIFMCFSWISSIWMHARIDWMCVASSEHVNNEFDGSRTDWRRRYVGSVSLFYLRLLFAALSVGSWIYFTFNMCLVPCVAAATVYIETETMWFCEEKNSISFAKYGHMKMWFASPLRVPYAHRTVRRGMARHAALHAREFE